MPFTLTMPKLSPTMEEGTITKWRKHVSDEVKVGDVIFEVATDKATVEHTALDAGFLRKILVEEGKRPLSTKPLLSLQKKRMKVSKGMFPKVSLKKLCHK
jgi:pyruvate dehydrogenase E2 component (dihydrolipoamide acetyltransferase)